MSARPMLPMQWLDDKMRQTASEAHEAGYRDGFEVGHRSGRFVWVSVGITVGLLLGAGLSAFFIGLGIQA